MGPGHKCPRCNGTGREVSPYLDAACRLTERNGDFDKYSLTTEANMPVRHPGFSRPVKAAQTWISSQGRRTGVTKRVASARPGAMKHGGEPARHVVSSYHMALWRKRVETYSHE